MIVGIVATEASGTVEREAALDLLDDAKSRHGVKPEPDGGPVEVAADVGDWGGGVPSGAIAEAEARVKRKEG